jgi:hypothetical protein
MGTLRKRNFHCLPACVSLFGRDARFNPSPLVY